LLRVRQRRRDSLRRVALIGQLRATSESQIAVIAISGEGPDHASTALQSTVDRLADLVGGRLVAEGPGAYNIATTRGAVEGELQRRRQRELHRIRETDQRRLEAARQAGIGPTTFSRLQAVLAELGTNQFTARDFARAYGVEPRSARRMLAGLVDTGLAQTTGAQAGPRAGRPQVVYELDVHALLASKTDAG
jgi:hypothetical protein